MPRNARIDIPGLLQHVIVRGIEKRTIFQDDEDRDDFLSRLGVLLQETETECYAWVLLGNHFHLLLQSNREKLGTLMRRLLTGYAVVFNLRHTRSGHLFQNRYKSIVCDAESYLLELIRYIHLNPVRAGMLKDLNELEIFPWCGHAELTGKITRNLINAAAVLSLFAARKQTALKNYRAFLADGIKTGMTTKLSKGGKRISCHLNSALADEDVFDDRILGGGRFVEEVLDASQDIPEQRPSLEELLRQVAGHFNVDTSLLRFPNKERHIVKAKSVLCYLAVRQLQLKGVEVARRLGYTSAAVTHAVKRGEKVLQQDEGLKVLLQQGWKLKI